MFKATVKSEPIHIQTQCLNSKTGLLTSLSPRQLRPSVFALNSHKVQQRDLSLNSLLKSVYGEHPKRKDLSQLGTLLSSEHRRSEWEPSTKADKQDLIYLVLIWPTTIPFTVRHG